MRRESLDLVLVDLWLSGAYDLSLVRELAKLGGLPIVILGDPPANDELKRALQAGASITSSTPHQPVSSWSASNWPSLTGGSLTRKRVSSALPKRGIGITISPIDTFKNIAKVLILLA